MKSQKDSEATATGSRPFVRAPFIRQINYPESHSLRADDWGEDISRHKTSQKDRDVFG